MANYRLYYFDPTGRHIEDFAEIESVDDCAAIRRVDECIPHGVAELWLGGRLIEQFCQSRRAAR